MTIAIFGSPYPEHFSKYIQHLIKKLEGEHINLIIEDLPYPYSDFKSSYVLLDRILPMKCRCLWKRSSHLQPVNCTKGISQYVSKESDFRNATILHSITDNYIK